MLNEKSLPFSRSYDPAEKAPTPLNLVSEWDQLRVPDGAWPFERTDIVRGLKETEKLLTSGAVHASLLLAWAAVEATLRVLIEEENLTLDQLLPTSILKQAVTNGLIARAEYHRLVHIMAYRNAVVHGFKTLDFDAALVRELISTTRRFLEAKPVGASP